MEGSGGGEDDDEGSAGDSGGAFAADEQGEEHEGLLGDGEVNAGGLRYEDQREGLVKAGAVEIEAVAGGKDEGDGFARDAEGFHLFHGAGESGFRAGGGEGDGYRFGGGGEEFFYGDSGEKRDGKENAGNEDCERYIHCG